MNKKLFKEIHYSYNYDTYTRYIKSISYKRINLINYYHNKSGLSFIQFHENGCLFYKEFMINNKMHNIKTASKFWYNQNNYLIKKEYYINDKVINIKSNQDFKKYIKLQNIL